MNLPMHTVTTHGRLAELLAQPAPNDLPAPVVGPTRLLILQPTSFCNIDCSYCYVPDRSVKGLMSMEVLERTLDRLVEEQMLSSRCSVVWHAGEPLTAGKQYLEKAFALVTHKLGHLTKVQLTIQTNGTLVDAEWIDLFRRYNVRVGVSLDGPQWLHDLHRKDRRGRGSYDATLRGLRLLQQGGISSYVLAVVTRPALNAAREFYEFFAGIGVSDVGLIPEEVDGINLNSSLEGQEALQGFQRFVQELHATYLAADRKPEIREFRGVREALFYTKPIASTENNKTTVYNILTVAQDGAFTSFSPELAGMRGHDGHDYAFGNVMMDGLRDSVQTEKFRRFYASFMQGVRLCEVECKWFALCGGGLPSNKLAEAGRLAVAETMSCQLHLQTFADTVLKHYNEQLLNEAK